MEVIGRIKVIEPEVQVSPTFKKRLLVVTTDEQYPQHILIEFAQDKCDLLHNYQVGQAVKVSINLRGREWINPQGEAKYFNQIQGWRMELQNPSGGSSKAPEQTFEATPYTEEEPFDDLPF